MGRERKGDDGLTGTQRVVLGMILSGRTLADVAGDRGVGVAAVQAVVRKLRLLGRLPESIGRLPRRIVVERVEEVVPVSEEKEDKKV